MLHDRRCFGNKCRYFQQHRNSTAQFKTTHKFTQPTDTLHTSRLCVKRRMLSGGYSSLSLSFDCECVGMLFAAVSPLLGCVAPINELPTQRLNQHQSKHDSFSGSHGSCRRYMRPCTFCTMSGPCTAGTPDTRPCSCSGRRCTRRWLGRVPTRRPGMLGRRGTWGTPGGNSGTNPGSDTGWSSGSAARRQTSGTRTAAK